MSADPVPVVSPPELPPARTLVCANCGAPLSGEFCSACGQRHEPHVHTLGHFASEAFESVTHADSRLWRTLGYLLVKPGHLSREFFDGHRVRYLPPFRLYLVISLLFFLVAGMSGMKIENEAQPSDESVAGLKTAADQLEKQFPGTPGIDEAAARLRERAADQEAELEGAAPAQERVESKRRSDKVQIGFCEGVVAPGANASWGQRSLFAYCQKISNMSGKALIETVVHNIPRAMFVFLPLLAAFMKLLYWRPKRYYVEHLLFLVHNHAFVFLVMILSIWMTSIPLLGDYLGWLDGVVWLYMIWYLFRAMRVYYQQSRWMTFGKYLVIGLAYIVTSAVVLTGTFLISALTL